MTIKMYFGGPLLDRHGFLETKQKTNVRCSIKLFCVRASGAKDKTMDLEEIDVN